MAARTTCGSCGSTVLQPILDLGETPLADAFPKTPDEPEKFYPLGLCVCRDCWLVQNIEIVPDDELYNGDYGFYTGASPASLAYFADYAKWAIERFEPKVVVEIASNDGTLLKPFADAGITTIGVEPSANVAAVANDRGLYTLVAPFGRRVASDLPKADLVIANNVVAHVSDLDDFLGGIADLLAPKGHAVIEFQYVADLLLGNQFDHVYHEHRSYFSLASLRAALGRHLLCVTSWGRTPAQGGSIRAIVERGITPFGRHGDRWLETTSAYVGLQDRVDYLKLRLLELVDERRELGPVVGYGATAKSTTLLNYCGIDLDWVEDLTPGKIGRYTPGTHAPIKAPPTAPKDKPPTYLLLAWNYLPSILQREWLFSYRGGKFILPIPVPTLL